MISTPTARHPESVAGQYDRIVDALAAKLPKIADHLASARHGRAGVHRVLKQIWRQIWSNHPGERFDNEAADVRQHAVPCSDSERDNSLPPSDRRE